MVYENHFAEKIREQLTYIPGLLVEVNVELDPHLRRVETRQRGDQLEFQEQAPLTPEHVTVAIAVPNAYFQRLAAEHDSGQELPKSRSAVKDDEIRKIESLVMNLLPPVRGGEDPYPRVRVHGYSAAPVATGARAALAAVHSTGAAPGNPPGPQPLTVAHTLLLAAIAGMLAVLLFRRSAPSRQLTLASRSLSEPETTGETRRAA